MLAHFLKLLVVAWICTAFFLVMGLWFKFSAVFPTVFPAVLPTMLPALSPDFFAFPRPLYYFAATFFFVPLLLLQSIIAWVVNRRDVAPRASWSDAVRSWMVETLLVVRVFCGYMAFTPNRFPDQLDDAFSQRGRRGVVFIHGFVCNRGIWMPWLKKLTHGRRAFVAVNLMPVFGSIDRYVDAIEQAVRKVTLATGKPPLVVCHSMGGLAVRGWLRTSPGADARVHHIITIGSPHQGTWLSRLPFPRNAQQMAIGSGWLKKLESAEPASRYQLFTCYYSNCDNIVFPASKATLPGAQNRHIPGIAHVALAFDQTVISESLARL